MLRSLKFTQVQWKAVGSSVQRLIKVFGKGLGAGLKGIKALRRRGQKPGGEAVEQSP